MATKKQLSINKLQLGLLSYPATDNVGDSLLDYSIQNDNLKNDFATDNQFQKNKLPHTDTTETATETENSQ